MKSIAIVANIKEFAEYIMQDISSYFCGQASFRVYAASEVEKRDLLDEDAIVLSSWRIFDKVKDKLRPGSILEVVSFTLSKENLKKMNAVKNTDRALLVNYDYRVCVQVITQLYELGYDSIDFIPYYGDEETRDKSIEVAITPNEAQLAPPGVELYDIGERAVEPVCILRLANKLGINGIFDSAEAAEAREKVALPQWGIDNLLLENYDARNNIKAVIEYIEDGILLCNNEGISYFGNEKARQLLQVDAVDGLNLADYIPENDLLDKLQEKKTSIVTVNGKKLIFTVSGVLAKEKKWNVAAIKSFEEEEERQHKLRNKLSGEKHRARYTFEDIKGESEAIREAVSLACRMAKSSSSVIILGESGTGKEVFAQSIHNASPRRNYNFVALNCAAIPENLLESELFGYEEGAFTGARKGGKIGYFELAHNGTIFLDEVGEMPLTLQGKILRVIEERKVAKIGSSRLVDVDVRIIAATNKNLKELVENGEFREDLYYRLNVLPIELPDLNQREEDVLILFEHFREGMGAVWNYDADVRQCLLEHKWRGNIREVRNVVEYLDNIGKSVIHINDLPKDFIVEKKETYRGQREELQKGEIVLCRNQENNTAGDFPETENKKLFSRFILKEGEYTLIHMYVLEALLSYKQMGKHAGRAQIKSYMEEHNLSYTVTEIRTSMHKLSEYGYVRALKGRGGSTILPEGERLLYTIKDFLGC